MLLKTLIVLMISILLESLVGCGYCDESYDRPDWKVFVKLPYLASSEKMNRLDTMLPMIELGMSKTTVESILGKPDMIGPIYPPIYQLTEKIGYTYAYLFYHDGVGMMGENRKLIRLCFNLNDRVTRIYKFYPPLALEEKKLQTVIDLLHDVQFNQSE